MTYRELFEAELDEHTIWWCRGDEVRVPGGRMGPFTGFKDEAEWEEYRCKQLGGKHTTGGAFAMEDTEDYDGAYVIHYGREVSTRATLQIALHEVGHVVLGHCALTRGGHRKDKRRSYAKEAEAENWSFRRMQELGVPVPRKSRARAQRYVAYKKARGDRVIAAKAAAPDGR